VTEQEWLACTDPREMLRALRTSGRASDRKLRLLGCACVRTAWGRLKDLRSRAAVEAAERLADGLLAPEEAEGARARGYEAARGGRAWPPYSAVETLLGDGLGACRPASRKQRCDLLRDLFGPLPFREVRVDPSWLTPAAVPIARGAYEGRDFTALPVLADALEEAGCDQPDVLGHLRGPGPHVRGCWAVDLLLGKS
jgi:hypothetical protein